MTLPRLSTKTGGKSPSETVHDLAGNILSTVPKEFDFEAVSDCKL